MIDRLGGFLQHNLVVCLAMVLIPLKIVVLRLCGDSEALAATFLAIPEDVGYVSLGLILGDIVSSEKSFRHYFERSPNSSIDIALVVCLNVAVAVIIHLLARWGNEHFKSFRAASSARTLGPERNKADQMELQFPVRAADEDFMLLQVRHVSMFSIGYGLQLAVSVYWLAWIAKVVAHG